MVWGDGASRTREHTALRLGAALLLGVLAVAASSAAPTIADDDEPPLYADSRSAALPVTERSRVAGSTCLAGTSPGHLDGLFESQPGGVIGADYQRTLELPDGRVLWTFQDAVVRLPDGRTRVVHNIGMVQEGDCFSVLMGGSRANPLPWLFAEHTTPLARWFWLLDAELGSDQRVYVFAAEMTEQGEEYLTRVEPMGTYVAAVDPSDWSIDWYGRPANAGTALYGFSIESDDEWTYLFAQCHRQFGFDPYVFVLSHDRRCADRVTVGRVPRGQVLSSPQYWTGRSWSSSAGAAVPIIETSGRTANPTQFVLHNNHWMAITKVDDWWGKRVVVERSRRPTGPFEFYDDRWPATKCGRDCNHYFASWILSGNSNQLTFGLSHNRFDGVTTWVYRPTFDVINALPWEPSRADRCLVGHCD